MNLKEAVNYHSKCIICQTDLNLESLDLAGVSIYSDTNGIKVLAGDTHSCYFKFDGTYEKMKRWNNIYAKPLYVNACCPICYPSIDVKGVRKKIRYKSRSFGLTTIAQAKDFMHAYQFEIYGEEDKTFNVYLKTEDIKFYDEQYFYHVSTNFEVNATYLMRGPIPNEFNLAEMHNTHIINLPAINTSKINNREQLINKIKLYNLFS
jgi:hypothetical protein